MKANCFKASHVPGDGVVILNIDGCASIIGFQEYIGKVTKVCKSGG